MALALAMNGPFWPALAGAEVPPFGTTAPRHPPSELWLAYGSEPPTLDPALGSDTAAADFIAALFAGLVSIEGPELRVEPDLAARWQVSADGRVYRFSLRPSRWSDGTPLTAHDFVFSVRRTLEPSLAAPNAQLLYPIVNAQRAHAGEVAPEAIGVRAIDAATLEIALAAPAPWFLQLCAHAALRPVPAHRLAHGEAWPKPAALVTSGPYQVQSWRFRRDAQLVANPHYWGQAAIAVRSLHFTLVAKADTGMALYEDGDLDLSLPPVPIAWLKRAAATADFRSSVRLASDYYWLNTTRPPLDDVRVRRALSLAIDRQQLTATVLRHAVPASSIVPPSLGGEPFGPAAFDPNRARALLAAAGYPKGRGMRPLSLLFNAHEEHRRVAEAIQSMWQAHLGIEVKLGQREWQVYLSEVSQQDFDIARLGWVADYADARSFLLDVLSPTSLHNYSGWRDAEYGALLARSDQEGDPTKRAALLKAAERRMLAAQPLLPVSFGQSTQLVKPYVHNYAPSPLGPAPYHRLRLDAAAAKAP